MTDDELAELASAPRHPDDKPWPHGWWNPILKAAVCPDGARCSWEQEWGHPCSRDVGGGYECDRLRPPEGWGKSSR